jgi:hypothetical protein
MSEWPRPPDQLEPERPKRCEGRLGIGGGGAEARTHGLALLQRGHHPLPQLARREFAQVPALAAGHHRQLEAHQAALESDERVWARELVRAIQVGAVRLQHGREGDIHRVEQRDVAMQALRARARLAMVVIK